MQTNFLNTPINPNLSYNIRTNYVGATIGRPQFQVLICWGVSFYLQWDVEGAVPYQV